MTVSSNRSAIRKHTVYFNDVDSAGHRYGPDSQQVRDSVVTVDTALAQLVEGGRAAGAGGSGQLCRRR